MGFFLDRTRVRLWSPEYGAYVRADESGEIMLHRDHGTLDGARAAHCLVHDANHYVVFHGAAYDQHLVQIVDGESPPGGHETIYAVQYTNAALEQDEIVFEAIRAEEPRQRQATQAPALAAKEPAPAMELFPYRTHVWLWIREYGSYLFAGEDGEVIACCRNRGTTRHRAWAVHRLVRDGTDCVLFHSAAYGRYLDHIDEDEFYHCRPVQCTYDSPEQAVRAENVSGDMFISYFTFGNWCHPDDEGTPMRGVVEAKPPRLLPPEPTQLLMLPGCRRRQVQPSHVVLRRTIHYVRADDQGNFNPLQWRFLQFDGQSLFNLRRDLAAELGEANNVLGITLCALAGSSGRMTPLVIDLPPDEKTMNIVVLTTGSPDFTLSVWATSQGRLTPVTDPSDDQPMDMVVISDLSQETDDIHNILPRRMTFDGIASRITEEHIGSMRVFLICAGDQYFLNVFNSCLQPIVDQVEQQKSYREFLGNPLQQTVPSTCAIVSSTKCVEVQHRWEYETYYGVGTFPCQAAAPRKLRSLCRRKKIWTSSGAYVGGVMQIIKSMGGIKTTNAPPPAPYLLPLKSWEQHGCDAGDSLTANRIMELLDSRGPFVGTFWVCPWYNLFDATEDENLVYRSGCARNKHMQDWSKSCFGQYKVGIGLHSVVCFAYRVVGGELHILILDNHTSTGPERWIHYYELQEIHTVKVKKLDPPIHLSGRSIVYPESS